MPTIKQLEKRVEALEHRLLTHPPAMTFGDFPELKTYDRFFPLFVLARQHHIQNPNLEEHQGWAVVYDESETWRWAIPAELLPEESASDSWEVVQERVHKMCARIRIAARKASAELGQIKVRKQTGLIAIKHVGPIPVADSGNINHR